MSTARAAIIESISKRRLNDLPSKLRKTGPSERLEQIREIAEVLLDQAESLERENVLAEASAKPDSLDIKSGIDLFDEVRRFEIKLIKLALDETSGNQAQAARLLGLGTTTLNYKIKSYQLM